MFAVIYRGYIKPGFEEAYQKHWKTVATYFVQKRGAFGSTLHRGEEGLWIAYSRWPNKATRDASWPQSENPINPELPQEIHTAIQELKKCFDTTRVFPEICMQIQEEISITP